MGNEELIARLKELYPELSRNGQNGNTDHLAYDTLRLSKEALILVNKFDPSGSSLVLQAQQEATVLLKEAVVQAVRYYTRGRDADQGLNLNIADSSFLQPALEGVALFLRRVS